MAAASLLARVCIRPCSSLQSLSPQRTVLKCLLAFLTLVTVVEKDAKSQECRRRCTALQITRRLYLWGSLYLWGKVAGK